MPASFLMVITFPSELGWMAAVSQGGKLLELTFGHANPRAAVAHLSQQGLPVEAADSPHPSWASQLQAFARGEPEEFLDVALDLDHLTPFQQRIVYHCRRIPFGGTMTYGELAARAGFPRAARAVGNVMAANRVPLVVPCHRVIPSSGSFGRYSAPGGVRAKLRLLEMEASRSAVAV